MRTNKICFFKSEVISVMLGFSNDEIASFEIPDMYLCTDVLLICHSELILKSNIDI